MDTDSPDRFAQLMEMLGAWSLAIALIAIGWDVSAPQEPVAPPTAVADVQTPLRPVTSAQP